MFRNYFKIAIRNLYKNKVFTLLNVFGLALAMTICLLIFKYVQNELSYDKFNASNNIYRIVYYKYVNHELKNRYARSFIPLGPKLKENFADVKEDARLFPYYGDVKVNNQNFRERHVFYVSPSFFRVFGYDLIYGDREKCLNESDAVVLSESTAKKYFGETNPIGKTITFLGKDVHTVKGVFKDITNSHLKADLLFSNQKFGGDKWGQMWENFYNYTYIMLKPGVNPNNLEKLLPAFLNKNMGSVMKNNNFTAVLHLQPIKDIHLTSNLEYELEVNAEMDTINKLKYIAFFILIMGWINFVSSSIFRMINRIKEIGIRKISGAFIKQITLQFMTESFILNTFSSIITVLVVILFLPVYMKITGIQISLNILFDRIFWIIIILQNIFGTLICCLYPSIIAISIKPHEVLKGGVISLKKQNILQKGLIMVQLVLVIVLLIGSTVIYKQIKYMKNQNLGYNTENVIIVNGVNTFTANINPAYTEIFKNEILKCTNVKNICASNNIIGKFWYSPLTIRRLNTTKETSTTAYGANVDYNYLQFFQLKIIAGRDFHENYTADENCCIINEEALYALGYDHPEKAINTMISTNEGGIVDKKRIIGVVRNFNFSTLKENIHPFIFKTYVQWVNYFFIKINPI